MKVLSIGTDQKIFDEVSGVRERSHAYAHLTEGYCVIVFTLARNKHKPFTVGNLKVYPTNSLSKWLYYFDAIKVAKKVISENGLNLKNTVITAQDPFETGLVGNKLKKLFGFPLQLQVHTDFLSNHFTHNILNTIRVMIAKKILPNADGIRVVSSVIRDSIQSHIRGVESHISVLPIFVDIEGILNFEPKADIKKDFPEFKFTVVMASRLSQEKRIDLALRSMKRVFEKFPHAGLVICGSGPEKNSLVSLAHKIGISDRVRFVGWREDLVSYFKTANLFLSTSEYEGYGMTLVEAGASGCPTVTTKVGLAKTDLFQNGKNCFICEFHNEDCVSKAIIDLISDNSLREVFSQTMQNDLRKIAITKEEYVKKYIGLLANLKRDG